MPDSEAETAAVCSCKVARTAAAYGLQHVHERLARRWSTGDDSIRELTEEFNRRVLGAALERSGRIPLEGEVANLYRLLTDADVDAGNRTQARERLRKRGVAVDDVEAAFVSHQTMYRHLVDCLDVSRDPAHEDADSRVSTWRDRLASLQSRTARVSERGIEQLHNAGAVEVGSFEVYVDVNVSCVDCGGFYTIEEFLDQGGCDCGAPERTRSA
jgi:hypothetical protein